VAAHLQSRDQVAGRRPGRRPPPAGTTRRARRRRPRARRSWTLSSGWPTAAEAAAIAGRPVARPHVPPRGRPRPGPPPAGQAAVGSPTQRALGRPQRQGGVEPPPDAGPLTAGTRTGSSVVALALARRRVGSAYQPQPPASGGTTPWCTGDRRRARHVRRVGCPPAAAGEHDEPDSGEDGRAARTGYPGRRRPPDREGWPLPAADDRQPHHPPVGDDDGDQQREQVGQRPGGKPAVGLPFHGWGRKVGPVLRPQRRRAAPPNGVPDAVFKFNRKGVGPVGPGGAGFGERGGSSFLANLTWVNRDRRITRVRRLLVQSRTCGAHDAIGSKGGKPAPEGRVRTISLSLVPPRAEPPARRSWRAGSEFRRIEHAEVVQLGARLPPGPPLSF